jgi:type I restriction enzyme, S subunit
VNTQRIGTPYITGPDQWSGSELHVDKWTSDPRRIVPEGCIFVTVKGAGVGTIFPGVPGAIGRDIYAFKPAAEVHDSFVRRALEFTVSEITRNAAGDIPGLSKDHLLKHHINVAPGEEQKRTVAVIDNLFVVSKSARDHLTRVPAILKRFRQAVLAAACSGRLTEDWRLRSDLPKDLEVVRCEGWSDEPLPSGWSVTTVGEVATVQGGKRLPKRTPYASQPTIHPYIRVTDFRNMSVSSEDLRYIDETTHRAIKRYTISESDLYISIAGTIGKVGLIPPHLSGANLTENAAKITELRNVRKTYLSYALNSTPAQDQIEEYITSSGQPKLALFRIEKLAFPLPPLEEQDEIVVRIENLFRRAEVIEQRLNRATHVADKLTQAILAKAFRGELVPTEAELARREGRDYEPASVLLEKIKKEREKEMKPTRRDRKSLAAIK